ncbi:hypothetical protein LCGC14_2002530 [marine sediment metagenome]|uniref:Uncharacterized protein n=1 Tax=marine sediment metagenome TaxID=412755 RepID=A0A0F9F2W9_9ZZZZ
MVVTETQLPLTGLELKERGIASVSRNRWVDNARVAAVALAQHFGWVTSDRLHDVMGPPPHDNCYGAIFKDQRFVATGERVRSTRPEAHGRWIEVWRLR